ncbi:MAG TPA: transposase [Anaerolineales bacterium]|nr:transposase [Anaerolineales bacterium]
MSKFDSQKYHRHSIRLPNYDYCVGGFVPPTRYAAGTKPAARQPGAYFVTIVTWHRECLFGEVVGGEMMVNKFGLVAKQQWEKLPKRFPNVELGAFVIMPNHMHGIIVITDGRGTAENPSNLGSESTRRAPTTREQFQKPVKGSIPTIVRSYKSAVSYRINLMRGTQDVPVWQRNYYEHIIRNDCDLQTKTDYIEANPLLWGEDNENPVRAV